MTGKAGLTASDSTGDQGHATGPAWHADGDTIALMHRLADASGRVIRNWFRSPDLRNGAALDFKADESPVTRADQAAEAAIRDMLEIERPQDAILGEEQGETRNISGSPFTWVIDPIDGTKAFATGRTSFGTLIALTHHGMPVLGLIDQPIRGERWIGGAGLPTMMNGAPVAVRGCNDPARAVLGATSPDMFAGERAVRFARLSDQCAFTIWGGDCSDYAHLACGWMDLVVEDRLQPWDFAALAPVVTGAGGIMTDWQGRALTLDSAGDVVAAGDARMHARALACLGGD